MRSSTSVAVVNPRRASFLEEALEGLRASYPALEPEIETYCFLVRAGQPTRSSGGHGVRLPRRPKISPSCRGRPRWSGARSGCSPRASCASARGLLERRRPPVGGYTSAGGPRSDGSSGVAVDGVIWTFEAPADRSSGALRAAAIVSTHYGGSLIEKTLQSLVDQDLPAYAFEIVVVDNNSSGGTSRPPAGGLWLAPAR